MVGVRFFPPNGPENQTQPAANQVVGVSSSGVTITDKTPVKQIISEALTLDNVADPIVEAAEEKYREPVAIMIARAYDHADHEKNASAFLKRLSDNQKQIIELITAGATPADLFCFGICLWVQTETIFKKRLNVYCPYSGNNEFKKDSMVNIQYALNFLNENGVMLSDKALNECFNSPSAFADLIAAVHEAELLVAYKILGSKVKVSTNNNNSSTCHPVHAFVAAGKKLNIDLLEGKQPRFYSGSHKNLSLLNEHDHHVKPSSQPALNRDTFLLLLKNEIEDPKWKSLGRFGRRAPDGILKLRDLFSGKKNLEPDHLFESVKAILTSKQSSYFGFGVRADATTQFYLKQYQICQKIPAPMRAMSTSVNI